MMKVEHEGPFFRCHARNLATKVHQARWHAYLEKEGQPVEVGAYSRVTAEMKAKDLVDLANSHGIKAALEDYVETGGALEKVANISSGLDLLIKEQEPRWRVSPLRLTLYRWQAQVWELVNVRPQPRAVIWCWGPPGIRQDLVHAVS